VFVVPEYYMMLQIYCFFFFFQAEDGIRDRNVTGVQTCALPISRASLANRRIGVRCGRGPGVPRAVSTISKPTRPWTPSASALKRSEERRVGKECRCRGARDQ